MSVVLAFDTATGATVACALTADGELAERRDDPAPGARPRHVQTLLALCAEALGAVGAGWDEVSRIGVGVGPGTFTGLRIGVASARAIAASTGATVAGIPTPRTLAAGAGGHALGILAVIDARRGEAFAAAFPAAAPAAPVVALPPAELAAAAGPGWTAVGDGAVRYRAELVAGGLDVPPDEDPRHRVGGAALVHLAAAAPPVPVATLVPDYVRLPDAELHRRRVAAGP